MKGSFDVVKFLYYPQSYAIMPNLVDVLNAAKDTKDIADLGVLDTEIPLSLKALSDIIEKEFANPDFPVYSNTFSNFSQGFSDGNGNVKPANGMPEAYSLGYNVGNSLSQPPTGMEKSYARATEQWQVVISSMREELNILMRIQESPLEFTLSYVLINNLGDIHIAKGISDIFNYDSDWSEKVLAGNITGQEISTLERNDRIFGENIRLGIYYLLNGELTRAHVEFGQAYQKSGEMGLRESLYHVYPSILKAHYILKPVRERVKVAMGFIPEQLAA